jgi:hypothetical protein
MERLSDSHSGDLGTDLFGEKDTLLDGLGREVRPIGRDQDVLEQFGLLWCLPLSGREDCRKSRFGWATTATAKE